MIISINATLCHTFQRLALLLVGRPGRQWEQRQPASQQQQPAGPKQRHSCGGRRTACCPPGHTAAGGPSGLSALSPAHEIPSKGTLSCILLYFSECFDFVNLIFRWMIFNIYFPLLATYRLCCWFCSCAWRCFWPVWCVSRYQVSVQQIGMSYHLLTLLFFQTCVTYFLQLNRNGNVKNCTSCIIFFLITMIKFKKVSEVLWVVSE